MDFIGPYTVVLENCCMSAGQAWTHQLQPQEGTNQTCSMMSLTGILQVYTVISYLLNISVSWRDVNVPTDSGHRYHVGSNDNFRHYALSSGLSGFPLHILHMIMHIIGTFLQSCAAALMSFMPLILKRTVGFVIFFLELYVLHGLRHF